ncbi:orotate phosphoribosyltransferase [Candidatus Methanoplasma termitum]|uniref:Orotate phosphoribosyltransferase n=1 Tax=Candidatus Methanoplasma termitum TaxID=1577791 RepID=A0A0A7LDA0_9ARCH|nr:orotate phosphoribosyltransferase [Candidatus Methanoplasma termitum]AIZ57110.1 orotate phosphoribosyltransferase [Candidatus Methanoplasma termitum]
MSEISNALEECGALQFGTFTLASGAKSDYYINIKKASTNPRVLYLISQLMAEKMQKENIRPDRIAGIVLGSIPLAAALSMATGIPFVMVRKEQKDHGTQQLIEGDLDRGENVLVIEDVVTSAGSSAKAIALLRENGAVVTDIMSVVDREGGGKENLAKIGVKLSALITGSEIVKGKR